MSAARSAETDPIKFPDTQYEPVELVRSRRLGQR